MKNRGGAESLSDSLRRITRTMHSLRTHQTLQSMAGTQIDKLSELILFQCLGDTSCQLRLSDIADRLGVELSGVSRKVHKLESNGLIERVNDPDDGRAWRLRLTGDGRVAVASLARARTELAERALADWSDEERQLLTHLLERFADDVQNELGNFE